MNIHLHTTFIIIHLIYLLDCHIIRVRPLVVHYDYKYIFSSCRKVTKDPWFKEE